MIHSKETGCNKVSKTHSTLLMSFFLSWRQVQSFSKITLIAAQSWKQTGVDYILMIAVWCLMHLPCLQNIIHSHCFCQWHGTILCFSRNNLYLLPGESFLSIFVEKLHNLVYHYAFLLSFRWYCQVFNEVFCRVWFWHVVGFDKLSQCALCWQIFDTLISELAIFSLRWPNQVYILSEIPTGHLIAVSSNIDAPICISWHGLFQNIR